LTVHFTDPSWAGLVSALFALLAAAFSFVANRRIGRVEVVANGRLTQALQDLVALRTQREAEHLENQRELALVRAELAGVRLELVKAIK
jgi:hypothetical protein